MNTHLFSGHAQLPTGTDIFENNTYLTVLVLIDIETERIVDCQVPTYCRLSNDFTCAILKGKSMNELPVIISEIDENFHTPSKRTLITALQTLNNRYTMYRAKLLKSE